MSIILYPDPVLNKPVPISTSICDNTVPDMIDAIQQSGAVGIAANQIGLSDRVIVINSCLVFVNPVITNLKTPIYTKEQCLSIPGEHYRVFRFNEIVIHYQDVNFKKHKREFKGVLACVIQHEIYHLNGILINSENNNEYFTTTDFNTNSDSGSC